MALSLELPLVAVSNCLSLCCPDFPLVALPHWKSFTERQRYKRSADYWHVNNYTTYVKIILLLETFFM